MARYSPYTRSFGGGIVNKTPSYQTTAIRGGGGGSGSSALYQQQDNTSSYLPLMAGLLGFMYKTRDKDANKDASYWEEKYPTLTPEELANLGRPPYLKDDAPWDPNYVPEGDEDTYKPSAFNGSLNPFNWNYTGLWNSLFGGN